MDLVVDVIRPEAAYNHVNELLIDLDARKIMLRVVLRPGVPTPQVLDIACTTQQLTHLVDVSIYVSFTGTVAVVGDQDSLSHLFDK